MSVYVDTLVDYTDEARLAPRLRKWWCHMTADTEDELRVFARRLGLKTEWIQYPGTPRVHFDVQPRYRAKAVAMGAIEETHREGALRMRAAMEAGHRAREVER